MTTGGTVYSSPALGTNRAMYIGSCDGKLYVLSAGGATNWTYQTRSNIWCSPAVGRDGTVFVGSDDGQFYVLNADGSVRWEYPVGSAVRSSPVIGLSGGVWFGTVEGNLYALPTGTSFSDGPWPMFRQNLRHTANVKTLILRPGKNSTSDTFVFDITGPAGEACDVYVTTNWPSSWTFFTNVTLAHGVATLQTTSTGSEHRFYRARLAQ